jgi:hypothetical protein
MGSEFRSLPMMKGSQNVALSWQKTVGDQLRSRPDYEYYVFVFCSPGIVERFRSVHGTRMWPKGPFSGLHTVHGCGLSFEFRITEYIGFGIGLPFPWCSLFEF